MTTIIKIATDRVAWMRKDVHHDEGRVILVDIEMEFCVGNFVPEAVRLEDCSQLVQIRKRMRIAAQS